MRRGLNSREITLQRMKHKGQGIMIMDSNQQFCIELITWVYNFLLLLFYGPLTAFFLQIKYRFSCPCYKSGTTIIHGPILQLDVESVEKKLPSWHQKFWGLLVACCCTTKPLFVAKSGQVVSRIFVLLLAIIFIHIF